MKAHERILDRLVPPDWEHVEKYPLTAASVKPKGTPTVLGINWYTDFDKPVRYGSRWFICPDGKVRGHVRGGHCVCIDANETDPPAWWTFYNQGEEGACVGFGSARMKSLVDRRKYDAFELFHATQVQGGYVGQGGAYVRDAMAVLNLRGAVRSGRTDPDPTSKISAYRWATKVEEIASVLLRNDIADLEAVPILNSWGRDYPHVVWVPFGVLQRLLDEDGEAAIATDE
jgi:hypothetical protein